MGITRENPKWPKRVYAAIRATIPESGFGDDLEVRPLASWLDGYHVHIVYRKNHLHGLFGLRYDTRVGITGTDWPEPETIGREIVTYALWEPHDDIPDGYEENTIYWLGDTRPDLPSRMEELPSDAQW